MNKRLIILSIIMGIALTFLLGCAVLAFTAILGVLSAWLGPQNLAMITLLFMCSAFLSFAVYIWLTLTGKSGLDHPS